MPESQLVRLVAQLVVELAVLGVVKYREQKQDGRQDDQSGSDQEQPVGTRYPFRSLCKRYSRAHRVTDV